MLDEDAGAATRSGIRLVSGGGDRAAAHALNVGVVSLLVGRSLGLAEDDLLDLGVGALMHDVGKHDLADRYRHADDTATAGRTGRLPRPCRAAAWPRAGAWR